MEEKPKNYPLSRFIRVSELTKGQLSAIQIEHQLSTPDATIRQLIHEHRTIPLLNVVYGTVY